MSTTALAVMLAGASPTLPDDADTKTPREVTATVDVAAAAPDSDTQPLFIDTGPPRPVIVVLPLFDEVPVPAEDALARAEDDNTITVNANRRHISADPFSGVNAASFAAAQAVDKVVVAPVAGAYEKAVPKPIRNGLRNFLINLAEPIVFVNYLLQFKPGKALETVGRFGINSTIGVAGLFDMAKRKPFRLPYRQNGFANTFAYHGIGNGPYLFAPVLGPTTARDLVGRILDLSVVPTLFGNPFNKPAYGLTTGTVKSMNDRVEFDEQIVANRAKADPYVATRDFYLKRRQAEIDALHNPEYRARKGIPNPVLPEIPSYVNDNAAPGSETAPPSVSIPISTGMVPAAPAPVEAVPGAPTVKSMR